MINKILTLSSCAMSTAAKVLNRPIILSSVLALYSLNTFAEVTLPALICDNAVLQQQSNVAIWGKSTQKTVKVITSWDNKSYKTNVEKDGTWLLKVDTPEASYESYNIEISDKDSDIQLNNILVGEVWLASGQSNMKVPMVGNPSQPIEGSAEMILKAKPQLPIRMFTVPEKYSFTLVDDCDGAWVMNERAEVANFGATPYFFAHYLQNVLEVPVGIINCSWGSSTLEAWMPKEVLESYNKDYDFSLLENQKVTELPQKDATVLYNGMMHSLENYKIKGMIWYQGEANRANHKEYPALFSLFAKTLRERFDSGDFPIYYAQIAPFGFGKEQDNIDMRISQASIMHTVERTGMVVLSDVGEYSCIHPRRKREVGTRFAYWALGDAYGYDGIDYRAPECVELIPLKSKKGGPNSIGLVFDNAKMGLSLATQKMSENFEVAGEDGIFYPAKMSVTRKAKHHIVLSSDKVEDILAVRYGYKAYFEGDVFNNFGIPISSFSKSVK